MNSEPLSRPANRPLSVAHLVWGLEMGGSQSSLLSITRNSNHQGLRTRVISFHGGAAAAILKEAGSSVTVLVKRPGFDTAVTLRLAAELERDRPDLLHCHDFTSCFWGNRAADRIGLRPRVATLHSWMLGLSWPKRIIYIRELRRMDRLIVLSRATRERLRRRGIDNDVLADLPVGPDLSAVSAPAQRVATRLALGVSPAAIVALTCARLEPEKNLPLLVELAHLLHADDPPIRFLVAGEGSRRAHLEHLVKKRGLEQSVTLLGLRRDVPALLAAADLFLLPSRSEELPLSVLEAMAAGLPVVATPVGALPEIVPGNPGAGFLIPVRDIEDWVRRVRDLAADPLLRLKLGEEGRRLVRERFDVLWNVAALTACYRELVSKQKRQDSVFIVRSDSAHPTL